MNTYKIQAQPGISILRTTQVPKHYLSTVYAFAPAKCQLSAGIDVVQQELKIEGGAITTDFINCKTDGALIMPSSHTATSFYLMLEGNCCLQHTDGKKSVLRQGQFYLLQQEAGVHTLQLTAGKYLLARITLYPFLLEKCRHAWAIIQRLLQQSATAGGSTSWHCMVTPEIQAGLQDILQHTFADAIALIALQGKVLQLVSGMLQVFNAGGVAPHSSLIHTIQCYIDNHLDQPLTLKRLVKAYPISETAIKCQFRQHVGEHFSTYLIRKRMELADRLLQESDLPIANIALQVGYEEPTNFTREYKRYFQRLPSKVRKNRMQT